MKLKKLLALLLSVLMLVSLAACGSSDKDKDDDKKEKEKANAAIEEYVDENKDELLEAMEESFATSSGMTCTSDIEVKGDGFIITININELDDVEDDVKDSLQEAYDSMDSTFEDMLEDLQTELEEIEYFEIEVCDVDGDVLATIHAGE